MRAAPPILSGAMLLAGCASLPAALPSARVATPTPLAQWLAAHPLAPDQELRIDELDRTSDSSMHLVQIRHTEGLHLHRDHDLMAMVQRGHGRLTLGSQTLEMVPGSVVKIPRGTPHMFLNHSAAPAVIFAVFTPTLNAPDTVPVADTGAR